MGMKALVPGHLLSELSPAADVLGITLVPYDKEGVPQQPSDGSAAMFRWWISTEQGDQLIRDHPSMRWIHTGSAGVDHILTPVFLASKIMLTNSAGVHAVSIAEWTVAGILALEKSLRQMFKQQKDRVWKKVECDELTGKRIVVLGGGRIASEIAKRLRPFDARLVCVRRHAEAHPLFDETYPSSELQMAVHDADWLILAVPLSRETRGVVDEEILRSLPVRCRLLNIARGEVIDQRALLEALTQNRIAGAVLDVFAEEPLPGDHPFWSMPQVIVLPHTTSQSPQVRRKQLDLFRENLRRFVSGEPLLNVVDVRAGY